MSTGTTRTRATRSTFRWAAVLLVVGFAAGIVFSGTLRGWAREVRFRLVPPSDAEWTEQVRLDAVSLLAVIRPDPRLPDTLPSVVWEAWDPRRRRYSPERLNDLRSRLHDFVEFVDAEHADCSEIYLTGRRPEGMSDAAAEARRRVAAALGADAAKREIDAMDALREEAFRSSPSVAGRDPDLPDFAAVREDIRRWRAQAFARADELTRPLP